MSDTETYNGWTNYATWGVALVLNNDQETYGRVRAYVSAFRAEAPADENVRNGIWNAEECARYRLSDWLKDYAEELCGLEDDPGPSLMARQVIQAGLAEVNWDEIADNVLSES